MTKREVAEKYCFGRTNPEEYNERAELWASLEKQVAEMQAKIKELKDSVTSSYEAKLGCLLLQFWLYDEQNINLKEDDSIQIIKPWNV